MNEAFLQAVTARVLEELERQNQEPTPDSRPRALLVGQMPAEELGYTYVREEPYEAVVVGSLTVGELLRFGQEQTLQALLQGMPVYLCASGIPVGSGKNRALETEMGSALNRLRAWGVRITGEKPRRRLITAQDARTLLLQGKHLPPGSILTPAARDILEDKA